MLTLTFNPCAIHDGPVLSFTPSDGPVIPISGFIPIDEAIDDASGDAYDHIDDNIDNLWLTKRLKAHSVKVVADRMLAKASMLARHKAFRASHDVLPDIELHNLTFAEAKVIKPMSTRTDTTLHDHLHTQDFQPQRYIYDEVEDEFQQLELTDTEDIWIGEDARTYDSDYDDILYNSEFPMQSGIRGRLHKDRKLSSSDESWLACHDKELEDISENLIDGYDTVSIDEVLSNDNEAWTRESTIAYDEEPIQFCKDSTEQDYDTYKLFGTKKGKDSAIWMAVRYSKASAIKRIQACAHKLDEDTLEWLREIVLSDDITLDSNLRAILPNPIAYKSMTGFIQNMTNGTHYTDTRQGYVTYPGTLAKARRALGIGIDEPQTPPDSPVTQAKVPTSQDNRIIHVDYFQSTKSLKEGFMNVWAVSSNKIIGSKQIKFLEDGRERLETITRDSKAKGFDVITRDVYNQCIESYGRSPLYSKARTLWANDNYIAATESLRSLV